MNYVTFDPKKRYTYKVEILQVYKPLSEPREKHETPVLLGVEWFTTPAAARNYGSNRTGRSKWYHSIGKPDHEYRRFHKETGEPMEFYEYGKTEWRKVEIPKPYEPDLDYRVYRVPVSLNMGEAVQLPALKKLYEVE